jgi:hypothetical protein
LIDYSMFPALVSNEQIRADVMIDELNLIE